MGLLGRKIVIILSEKVHLDAPKKTDSQLSPTFQRETLFKLCYGSYGEHE